MMQVNLLLIPELGYISKILILLLEQGKDAARIFADDYTITACKLAISFWEEREDYKKCAHIKKVQDFLELNVIP